MADLVTEGQSGGEMAASPREQFAVLVEALLSDDTLWAFRVMETSELRAALSSLAMSAYDSGTVEGGIGEITRRNEDLLRIGRYDV